MNILSELPPVATGFGRPDPRPSRYDRFIDVALAHPGKYVEVPPDGKNQKAAYLRQTVSRAVARRKVPGLKVYQRQGKVYFGYAPPAPAVTDALPRS